MATKPKTRKAPAAKARAFKAAPKAPATETKEQVSEIQQLIARWKWLDADKNYQVDISTTDDECDRAADLHEREKAEILRKLIDKRPETFLECRTMLDYATNLVGHSDVEDDDIIALLKNVRNGLRIVQGDERRSAHKEGMEKMRLRYLFSLDVANRLGTSELLDKL
ncbi:hypothetical protein QEV83_07765 [Methylocapsa sp. D3K7]|uniref:hypothetical protein n=1 Tax=Methylocapsa sp. D3K7 TaxID=3041435 RepID=UPI00244E8830|nr:hypothetical protein [Methylocapsa sp. D3K7]WGJ16128.1 hypothetical protein QEV83_07765 [Methylocapsa sp. D3K7]